VPRRSANLDYAAGQDSFLDVVANIVGILIIVVMLVGVRSKDAFIAAKKAQAAQALSTAPPPAILASQTQAAELEGARREVLDLRGEVEKLSGRTQSAAAESSRLLETRNALQQLAVAAEQLIADERGKLDQSQQEQFDLRRQLQAAEGELEDLAAAKVAIENTASDVEVLKHMPTPMAKTVFGEEAHFRLLDGNLVYVPLTELAALLQKEAKLKFYKLEEASEVTETLGPIGGFHLKYTLHRTKLAMNTSQGTVVRDAADLKHFILVPDAAVLGEPLDEALADGSSFRERLKRYDPNRTTITVWTYPDSFDEFRRLKEELFRLGYLTAGRPMPEGQPIGGSPHGSRSAAE
jgi:hypothetical protein